jgi:hypothetical protein
MRIIAEPNLLLRVKVELPEDLKLATNGFGEGWNVLRSIDALLLKKRLLSGGWTFVKVDETALSSGVGKTAREAIGSALRSALRRLAKHLKVADVEHIQLTQYPWFYLARVRVLLYLIQQGKARAVIGDSDPLTTIYRRRPMQTLCKGVTSPSQQRHASALKQSLISSEASEIGPL